MKKIKKGEFAYYNHKRKTMIILTILYFAISIALYVTGYAKTGSNKNLLTLVAVLGMLPASKSAVEMIMYIRYHGCSKEQYDLLHEAADPFVHAYGLVMTTYKKNFEVASCIVKNGYVYAYLTNHHDSVDELQKHMSDMIRQNGLKGTAGVFVKTEDYCNRLQEIQKKEDEDQANDKALLELMLQLSL